MVDYAEREEDADDGEEEFDGHALGAGHAGAALGDMSEGGRFQEMNAQPLLFDAGLNRKLTLQERFEEFHRANPRVYRLLVQYARRAREKGFKTYGIGALYEIIRWEAQVPIAPQDEFKLNNVFRSRYARLIMERETDLAGFFNVRELKSK